jgi:voltage-dependent potassium channel beta subunit
MGVDDDKMIYRHLGRTGLKVSLLSYGAWVTFGNQVDVAQAKTILKLCYDAGVNFFDNAEVYEAGKAEEVMGQAFKELDLPRSSYVLTTKIFWGPGKDVNAKGLSRKHIIEGTKASLKRLQADYVDVIFAHRPDPATPIEETVRAFNYLIDHGYAFYWGTSEWTAQQLEQAYGIADRLGLIPPSCEQPQYNIFERKKLEGEYLPLFEKYGLGTTIWSPLASGLLTGKYSKDHIPEGSRLAIEKYKGIKESSLVDDKLEKVDKLKEVAKDLGATLPQLALAWAAHNPNVSTVLMGGTKTEQLEDNLQALKFLDKLTPEVLQKIDDIFQNKPEAVRSYR